MGVTREENGAIHFLGILLLLLFLGGLFLFFSNSSQIPVIKEDFEVMKRRLDTMQNKIDDLDTQIKILQMKAPTGTDK